MSPQKKYLLVTEHPHHEGGKGICQDVKRLWDGDAMIHALNVVGYQSVGMK